MMTAAGASALVAGSKPLQITKKDEGIMTETLPDYIRVEALKGFRAHVDGRFAIVNPGDVVEVSRATAIDLRMANKAIMTDKKPNVQKDYLPERKRTALAEKKRSAPAAI